MNTVYNYGSRRRLRRRPASMGQITMPEINQDTIIKWVIVPGATVATLFVLTRLVRRKKGGKK